MSFDISRLIEPISDTFPLGEDIRASSRVDLYYRLKDARSSARADERNIDPGEAFRLSAAWGDVRSISLEILQSISKDIEVLAWLCEAQLRLEGFGGLAQSFDLAAHLVRGQFGDLHSIDGDGPEDKVSPFAGLNGVGGEGTLIQPVRLSPLVPSEAFFRNSLWDFQMAQRPGEAERLKELQDAVNEAGPAAMRAHLDGVQRCQSAFADLTTAFGEACGPAAPASANIRAVLEEVRLAIVNLSGLRDEAQMEEAGWLSPVHDGGPARAPAAAPAPRGPVRSREEAFERLLEIARYFRAAEPQSPLAAAIETVVARGRLDFSGLLAELVEDDHQRRSILIAAGIKPESGGL